MEPSDVSSQEKLDQMLRDKKITAEDYLRLSKAMAEKRRPTEDEEPHATTRPRLRKSWKNRQAGGVCAGIAEHLGVAPIIVRIVAVICALIALPATMVIYLVLYYILPWDDKEAACEPRLRGHPWRFGLGGVFFLTLLPWVFSQFSMPSIVVAYKQLGAELPSWTQISISLGRTYQLDPSFFGTFPWGIFLSLLIVFFATSFYLICHNRRIRRAYVIGFFVLSVSWSLFLVGGCCVALLALLKTIQ